jgi:hypothetical protein
MIRSQDSGVVLLDMIVCYACNLEAQKLASKLMRLDNRQSLSTAFMSSNHSTQNCQNLQQLITDDICESTRCLAFDLSAAVGFHIYRAVEAIVLEYLDALGIERSRSKTPAWERTSCL